MILSRLIVDSVLIVLCVFTDSENDQKSLLYDLDTKITNELTEPTEGRGSKVMKELEEYNHQMFNALQSIDQGVMEIVAKGKKLAEMGGPQILDALIDKGLLRHCYSWGEEELLDLKDELREANETWHEIKDKLQEVEARGNGSSSSMFSSWEFIGDGMSSKNQDESLVEYVSNETGNIHVNNTRSI